MTSDELKEKYWSLYEYMANSKDPKNMKIFGGVMTQMVMDMIASSPSKAEEYIDSLEAVKWRNYLSPKEAQKIVDGMVPKAPWTRDVWKQTMEQHGYELEKWPCYNRCSLWTTMNMIMSDSSETLKHYVDGTNLFKIVYDLAIDRLQDPDKVFDIRKYFGV